MAVKWGHTGWHYSRALRAVVGGALVLGPGLVAEHAAAANPPERALLTSGSGFLLSVSCKSSVCVAVGQRLGAAAKSPLAEIWRGAGWKVSTLATPTGASVSQLQGVSCPSTTSCTAVGGWENAREVACHSPSTGTGPPGTPRRSLHRQRPASWRRFRATRPAPVRRSDRTSTSTRCRKTCPTSGTGRTGRRASRRDRRGPASRSAMP